MAREIIVIFFNHSYMYKIKSEEQHLGGVATELKITLKIK